MKIVRFIVFSSLFVFIASYGFAQESMLAANYLIQFGKTYYDQESYLEAKQEFERCLLADPNNRTAKEYLAKISAKLKQTSKITDKQANRLAKQTSTTISKRQAAIQEALNNINKEDKNQYVKEKLQKKPKTGLENNLTVNEEKKKEAEKKFETWVGGAWTLPRNLLYLEIFMQYYWHNQQFNNSRKKVYWAGGGKDIERNVELKIDYGITDNLTCMISAPHKSLLWKDVWQRNRTKGVSEVWTGLKYKIVADPITLTPRIRVKIPTNYNPNKTPSLGKDQWDYEFMLLTAKNFQPWPFYAKFDTGYRVRSGSRTTDEIPYFFEAGYVPFNWLLLKTTIDGVNGIGGTGETQEDYTKFTVGTLFNFFRQCKFEFGYGRTFAGKNTSAADEWYFKTIALF
ncbi:MAG: hypothetical protein AB1755_02190 [Candidatus Omnitrophota bacterium]